MFLNKQLDDSTTTTRQQHLKTLSKLLEEFDQKDEKFHTVFTKGNTILHVSKKFTDIKVLKLDLEHTKLIQKLVDSDVYGVEFTFKPENIRNFYKIGYPNCEETLYFNWSKFNTTPAKFVGPYSFLGSGTWIICDVIGRQENYFLLVRNKEANASHTPIVGQSTQGEANEAAKGFFEYVAPDAISFNPETNALKELSEELGNLIEIPTTLNGPIAEFVFNGNNKTTCYAHKIVFTLGEFNNFVEKCKSFQNSEVGSLVLVSDTFIANIVEERFTTDKINKFSTFSNDSWLFGYNPELISKHWFLALQHYMSSDIFKGRYKAFAEGVTYCKITLH